MDGAGDPAGQAMLTAVLAFVGFLVLIAVIVRLSLPWQERVERHGKHSGFGR